MILTAAARTLLVATLAAFVWTHHVEVSQLYVLSFFFGVADAFAAPAAQTLLPSLVAPGAIARRERAVAGHAAGCDAGRARTGRHRHRGVWRRIGVFH